MLYILDTNTFITAKNTFYAYDIVPSFWSTLLEIFKLGKVKVIDAVAGEIADGNDDLADWFGENIKKSADDAGDSYVIQAKQNGTVLQNYQNNFYFYLFLCNYDIILIYLYYKMNY